ncbi:hypothetical protein GPALN_010128 [Globodera pallida]|nr:hypothetical protein GPALN_010128 [Globodera pallida]
MLQLSLLLLIGLFAFGMAQLEPVHCPSFQNKNACLKPKIMDGNPKPASWCQWVNNACLWDAKNIGARYCFMKTIAACDAPFCILDSRQTHQCQNAYQACLDRSTASTCQGTKDAHYAYQCRWYPAGATQHNEHFHVCGAP